MTKKHRRKTNRPVVQRHHIMYEPEWVVTVWRGEHFILTQLQWRKRFSKGFITALKEFIRTQEEKAYNLDESIENDVLKT